MKYKYQFKIGNKVIHGSIINDLDRPREKRAKNRFGMYPIATRQMHLPTEQEKGF